MTQFPFVAWLPLSDITSPERAKQIIAAEEARIEQDLKSPNAPPGLREQYDIQLEILKDPKAIDAEFVVTPLYLESPLSTCLRPSGNLQIYIERTRLITYLIYHCSCA